MCQLATPQGGRMGRIQGQQRCRLRAKITKRFATTVKVIFTGYFQLKNIIFKKSPLSKLQSLCCGDSKHIFKFKIVQVFIEKNVFKKYMEFTIFTRRGPVQRRRHHIACWCFCPLLSLIIMARVNWLNLTTPR
jgi:hypothetical protein